MRYIPYGVAAVLFLIGLAVWAFFYYTQKHADGGSGASDGDVGLIVLQVIGLGLMALAVAFAVITGLIQWLFRLI